MKTKQKQLTTKRFVIRQSLIGTNTIITFTNKKGELCTYDHDKVYNDNKSKFDNMLALSNISLTLVLITYQHLLDNNCDNCLLLLYVNLLMSHLVILQTKYDINWIIYM
jgi:hypothetical protein